MNDAYKAAQERSVLRWGGLAGIAGGLLLIAVFVIVGVFMETNHAEPEGFPDIRAALTIENSLYLAVLVLWTVHFLAMYRALRGTSLAPALFGSAMGIMGLGLLAAGALPHVATAHFSGLYHAPGTPAGDQAMIALSWQAAQAMFDSLLIAGLSVVPMGVIAFGIAMLGSPDFGKGFGGVGLALGVAGGAAACAGLVEPGTPVVALGVFALIIFHLVVGWKVYRLSRGIGVSLEGINFERRRDPTPEAVRITELTEETK